MRVSQTWRVSPLTLASWQCLDWPAQLRLYWSYVAMETGSESFISVAIGPGRAGEVLELASIRVSWPRGQLPACWLFPQQQLTVHSLLLWRSTLELFGSSFWDRVSCSCPWTPHVPEDNPELLIVLPTHLKIWYHRYVSPYPIYVVWGIKPRASCMLNSILSPRSISWGKKKSQSLPKILWAIYTL